VKTRKAAVIFIFVTVTLDILAMGLIIPVLPKLILDFLGGKMTDAADSSSWFALVFALMQFFFSPVLGVLSDRFGRRPVILLSNLGLGLDYIVMALAPSLAWLFLGRVISGITTSSIPTAMAYISDVVPKEKRAGAFGMIGVAFGIGFTLGPALGGLLSNSNPRLAFYVAGGFSLANWLWGYFFVPESLPREKRKEFELRRANPVGSLVLLRSHPELWRLATIQFLAYTAHNVFSVWALYAIYRYAWNQLSIGISLMVVGVCTAVISGGLTGRMVKWFGERRTLYIGQFFGATGMFVAGLARSGAAFLGSIPIISAWNISMPAAQSMMTHRVSEREQGELQGALQSMRSITFIIGPVLFLRTFSWFIDPKRSVHMPGAPFYLAALLLFTAMIMSTRIRQPEMDKSVAGASNIIPDVVPTSGLAPPELP
jgi:DHA1 family tetracycline resistance protein-like MFS transporter